MNKQMKQEPLPLPAQLPQAASADACPDMAAANDACTRATGHMDADLQQLIVTGRQQGYLTFDQVNTYLPDEAVDPEKIDALLVALEESASISSTPLPPPMLSRAASQKTSRRSRVRGAAPHRNAMRPSLPPHPTPGTIRSACIWHRWRKSRCFPGRRRSLWRSGSR